jgi:hypothetical protein
VLCRLVMYARVAESASEAKLATINSNKGTGFSRMCKFKAYMGAVLSLCDSSMDRLTREHRCFQLTVSDHKGAIDFTPTLV